MILGKLYLKTVRTHIFNCFLIVIIILNAWPLTFVSLIFCFVDVDRFWSRIPLSRRYGVKSR